MNLREYASNCPEVNNAIPEKDRAPSGMSSLLGVKYNKGEDRYYILTFPSKEKLTKKDIVSQLNSIYDPIGIEGPLTIRLKHLMREIYASGAEWKDPIPDDLAQKWITTCQKLNNVSTSLPRYINMPNSAASTTTLWAFADASTKALSSCVFLRDEERK
uniref:Uncharacterized protein n=1 Tax=Heligmosomoides polygyrus TaxID=6339 RepID=A0A183G9K1_HELPZ